LGIFVAAVIVTFFTTVEIGIYLAVSLALALLLFKLARPTYEVLTRLRLYAPERSASRYVYVPTTNPYAQDENVIDPLPKDVIVFKFDESLTYPNASYISDTIIHYVRGNTKRGKELPTKKGDRPWNDSGAGEHARSDEVVLRALVLDFGAVNNLDTTGVQALIDVRRAVNRYADREVPWHFAGINSYAVRHALLEGGFGLVKTSDQDVGDIAAVVPDNEDNQYRIDEPHTKEDLETGVDKVETDKPVVETDEKGAPKALSTTNPRYPFFHYDLDDAVAAATST